MPTESPIISSYIHSSPLSHSHPTHRVAVDLVERKKDGNGKGMRLEDSSWHAERITINLGPVSPLASCLVCYRMPWNFARINLSLVIRGLPS